MNDTSDEAPNEILAAARDAKRHAAEAAKAAARRRNWPRTAVSVGIGSAAVAAALIFANRARKD